MKISICTVFVLILIIFNVNSLAASSCMDGYVCSKYISLFEAEPKYKENFKHLDYANPSAKKGGTIKYAATGTFDSLNQFILKGVPASGLGLIYDTLMTSTLDDIFTRYPLIAESVMIAKDNKSIIFVIDKNAKWHDGVKITADDVVFTFNTLIEKGNPTYASYYADVENVEKIDEQKVRFNFKKVHNRELPMILSELTVLPKHFYKKRKFDETTLDLPLGNSAYEVDKIDAGRSITYKRNEDYWAKDLPINKGRNNFDTEVFEYYRDDTVAVEALKAGDYDIRTENIARIWQTAYDTEQFKAGKLKKLEIPHDLPTGMQCFILNLRKDKFSDIKVRQALELAFDFEWANKTLFYNSYARTRSYFSNSIYEAKGKPEGLELSILKKFKNNLPKELFETEYNPPKTEGDGNQRENLRKSIALLKEAGWSVVDKKLQNQKGEAFNIEFLINSSTFERVIEPYISNLARLGIEAKIRLVDPAQYIKRTDDYDFDVVVSTIPSSQIPGNELRTYFSSKFADVKGGNNLSGIKNEIVDKLVDKIITAKNKDYLIAYTKALDRVLQFNHYVVPHWNIKTFRLVHWDKFSKPEYNPPYGLGLDTWWIKESPEEKSESTDK
jgi:microcin C transport system substrate-binding protein